VLLHPNRPYFFAPTGARRPPMWRAAASRNHQIARTYGPWPCQARRRPVKMSALQQVLTGRCVRLFPPLEGLRAGDFWVRVNPARRFPYRYSVSFASLRRRSGPRHLVPVESDMAACDPHPPAVPQSLWKAAHTTCRRLLHFSGAPRSIPGVGYIPRRRGGSVKSQRSSQRSKVRWLVVAIRNYARATHRSARKTGK
jgi:hypothetical protein